MQFPSNGLPVSPAERLVSGNKKKPAVWQTLFSFVSSCLKSGLLFDESEKFWIYKDEIFVPFIKLTFFKTDCATYSGSHIFSFFK